MRTRARHAGAALEEQQPAELISGLVRVLRRDDLAGEHGDLLPAGIGVIERYLEAVLGDDGAALAIPGQMTAVFASL